MFFLWWKNTHFGGQVEPALCSLLIWYILCKVIFQTLQEFYPFLPRMSSAIVSLEVNYKVAQSGLAKRLRLASQKQEPLVPLWMQGPPPTPKTIHLLQ